jgi:hypothetical protein
VIFLLFLSKEISSAGIIIILVNMAHKIVIDVKAPSEMVLPKVEKQKIPKPKNNTSEV